MADSSPPVSAALPDGVVHLRHHLDLAAQRNLVGQVLQAIGKEFWFQPTTPRWNRPFSVRMSNLGTLGWVSDRRGYRYQPDHPESGLPWPAMPKALLDLWREVASHEALPEACLVNLYRGTARMGLHQDRDEHDLTAPVVSVSLGDTAIFRLGGTRRGDSTRSFPLASGDVLVLGGPARLAFHGVDRILPGSSTLLPGGGRINLTLRRVGRSLAEVASTGS
ncbi:alpha-ketoglutarate-dependent dioxygenase AlkB family protein [Geminicoccus flavidas]|uniref:alpha-ketoglutarate-dependent dioxygenase AlkB family protein n=1 Tax=Geminicoccus flavidas TaxID=2506407 RepID=UPI001F1922EF|nr:alpha-ketoglutarate-dependent dioxygenase AlkB [Geminicoccus flavidas]